MGLGTGVANHRKRKRRRTTQEYAVRAKLVLDSNLTGDIGLLSEDLYDDLFSESTKAATGLPPKDEILHVAITPYSHSFLVDCGSTSCTILAVGRSSTSLDSAKLPPYTIQLPRSYTTLQPFFRDYQTSTINKDPSTVPSSVDVQLVDVIPISLETVVVSVDEVILEQLDNANRRFHYGRNPLHPDSSVKVGRETNPGKGKKLAFRDRVINALRGSLGTVSIVHSGDVLPLSSPSQSNTLMPQSFLSIEFCAPVSQGYLLPDTKIVIIPSAGRINHSSSFTARPSSAMVGVAVEEDDDTSNEQFFSAAEESMVLPAPMKNLKPGTVPLDQDHSESSSAEQADLSDSDSDTIGLSFPSLLSQPGAVTSRPGHYQSNGIASPGSVYSAFSTSTVVDVGGVGRLFEAHGLMSEIPSKALHPEPASDEDSEARVFVGTTSLTKIGCFSGDWVKIEYATNDRLEDVNSWAFGHNDSAGNSQQQWRVAKVYALPIRLDTRPRYAIDKTGQQRFGSLARLEKPSLKAYLSPLFLCNLGNPENVRIASLKVPRQPSLRSVITSGHSMRVFSPPPAKEVIFSRLTTPSATEADLLPAAFWAFKMLQKQKYRIIKSGDLLAIPIDPGLGRAVYRGTTSQEDLEQEELLSPQEAKSSATSTPGKIDIAWYRIKSVTASSQRGDYSSDDESPWGDAAVLGPATPSVEQVGHEPGKLPDTLRSTWQYYLGVKRLPATADCNRASASWLMRPPEEHISETRRRLRELISAATSIQAIHLALPAVAVLLTSSQRHSGKATIVSKVCSELGLHVFSIDAYDILTAGSTGGADVNTAALLEARADRAMRCGSQFTALLIKHIEVLNAERIVVSLRKILGNARVLIATTTDIGKVAEGVRSLFTHEIQVSAPDEKEREGLLRDIVRESGLPVSVDVDYSTVAMKTAALVVGDLVDVLERAVVARQERIEKLAYVSNRRAGDGVRQATVRDVQLAGGEACRGLVKADFDTAVDAARKNFADAIGAPKIPKVSWDDVGGLTQVKDAVMETIQLPLERPELFAKGMKKRSGILFYGPPGTGKTLLAKAIATEFSLNFFSVKGPELLNMYIGESEANVRRVFQRARDARPCVVFFDELDSVAPKRGNQGDSGGVMDRIVSQLLAELDGMSNGEDGTGGGVFVIGATNRPDLLDQALLRPGRFDKMLYLGVSDTHEKQLTILEALTRKFTLHHDLSLAVVASHLPFTYTGADLYALCSDAMLKAITRRADAVDAKVQALNSTKASHDGLPVATVTTAYFFDHLATEEDTSVVVEQEDFEAAMQELVPSVSVKELEHYERVKKSFEQGGDEQKVPPSSKQQSVPIRIKPQYSQPVEVTARKLNGSANGKMEGKPWQSIDNDDFVLKTEGLSSNAEDCNEQDQKGTRGKTNGLSKSKGKGKGRRDDASDHQGFGFGDATAGDEEFYSAT